MHCINYMRLEGIKHVLESSHMDNLNHEWNKMTRFNMLNNMHICSTVILHT